jgi:hypothetical protein
MVMMLKPNNNPHTGRVLLCLAPKKTPLDAYASDLDGIQFSFLMGWVSL